MRCSYCSQKGHTKRNCPHLPADFERFKKASQAIRQDYLALLAEKKLGVGAHFRVSNYGNVLVKITDIQPIGLFHTWGGRRTMRSFLPLEKMAALVVEQCPDGIEGESRPWIRRFSVWEIIDHHTDLVSSEEEFWDEDTRKAWLACSSFSKPNDMLATLKKKERNSVFGAATHPYLQK